MDWQTDANLPVGEQGAALIAWVQTHGFFSFSQIEWLLEKISGFLSSVHPSVPVLGICVIAFILHRSLVRVVILVVAMLFVLNQGYWGDMVESLVLVAVASGLAALIGFPAAYWMARFSKNVRATPAFLVFWQSIPSLVFLVPIAAGVGAGLSSVFGAALICALPHAVAHSLRGLQEPPAALLLAARSHGATHAQIFREIQLPHAVPHVLRALHQVAMAGFSVSLLAGLMGAPGLGAALIDALDTLNISLAVEVGIVVLAVTLVLDQSLRVVKS